MIKIDFVKVSSINKMPHTGAIIQCESINLFPNNSVKFIHKSVIYDFNYPIDYRLYF